MSAKILSTVARIWASYIGEPPKRCCGSVRNHKKYFFHFWSTPGCFGGLRQRNALVPSIFSRILRNLAHPSPHTAPVDFEKLQKAPFGQVFGDISKHTESIRDGG